MRTAIIIISGLAIWAIGIALARHFGKPGGTAVADSTLAFVTFWLLATATNLWVGVAQAGYTLREEWPIAALSFGVPAAVAAIANRKFL